MKIALAQINTTVGDLAGNRQKMIGLIEQAKLAKVELIAFPEMAVTGYPPQDLLRKNSFLKAQEKSLHTLAQVCMGITAVVGFIDRNLGGRGKPLFNCAAVLRDGKIKSKHAKSLIPTYDVFDEGRYFEPAKEILLSEIGGVKIAITICEDIWNQPGFSEGQLYDQDPIDQTIKQGAQLLLNISASPFHLGKTPMRSRLIETVAKRHAVPVCYVNLVGGNDSLIFDGASLAASASGQIIARGASFAEELLIVDCDLENGKMTGTLAAEIKQPARQARSALVLGLQDYVQKCGFTQVLIGLSGGIDSALTAALAVEALGAKQVWGVAMPSRYSSQESVEDAATLAKNLGIRFDVLSIEKPFQAYLDLLQPILQNQQAGVAEENLQARLRGTLLMGLSNQFGHLLLTTGNKSEMAVGYCTLYGDMNGGLAVIADCPKTLVYSMARTYPDIPPRSLTKPPSAELKPNQKDSDSLPEYEVLDPILKAYIEEEKDLADIVKETQQAPALVEKIIRMVDRAEYKRRQAPPALRITSKAFSIGRDLPIAQRYEEGRV